MNYSVNTQMIYILDLFYNTTVRPVICEGLHFTHMCRTSAWLHHFTKKKEGAKLV